MHTNYVSFVKTTRCSCLVCDKYKFNANVRNKANTQVRRNHSGQSLKLKLIINQSINQSGPQNQQNALLC